jgi:hypothetical protein
MKENQIFHKINNEAKCRLFYINDNSPLTSHYAKIFVQVLTHKLAMQFTKTECHSLFQNSHNAGHRTVLEKIAVSV